MPPEEQKRMMHRYFWKGKEVTAYGRVSWFKHPKNIEVWIGLLKIKGHDGV